MSCVKGTGTWEQGACFGVPFRWSSLLKKGKPLLHYRQKGAKAIPNMRQPALSPSGLTWDYRPFAEGVAAAHGMSWWRRFSGINGGSSPASLGVTHHCRGSGRALPSRVACRLRQMASPLTVAGAKRGVSRKPSCDYTTSRTVVDLIIDLPARPDEINDATPCKSG